MNKTKLLLTLAVALASVSLLRGHNGPPQAGAPGPPSLRNVAAR